MSNLNSHLNFRLLQLWRGSLYSPICFHRRSLVLLFSCNILWNNSNPASERIWTHSVTETHSIIFNATLGTSTHAINSMASPITPNARKSEKDNPNSFSSQVLLHNVAKQFLKEHSNFHRFTMNGISWKYRYMKIKWLFRLKPELRSCR